MKQFCPKCCKWYEMEDHKCPICGERIFPEKVISNMHSNGTTKLLFGFILFIVGILFLIFQYDFDTDIGIILGIIGLLFGFILIYLGAIDLINYNNINKKLLKMEMPDNEFVKCPYCGSGKVTKLTVLDRTASVVVTGIASGKIGKQWHCNNCDSNF